jgi:malate dehydrogenase
MRLQQRSTMVDAISGNRRRVLPCVCILTEYGQRQIPIGVPAVLGKRGIDRIIELPLNETERSAFQASVNNDGRPPAT